MFNILIDDIELLLEDLFLVGFNNINKEMIDRMENISKELTKINLIYCNEIIIRLKESLEKIRGGEKDKNSVRIYSELEFYISTLKENLILGDEQ